MDAERLDAIVAAFYEAAVDPHGWHDALLAVARCSAADNFHLMVWDPQRPQPLHSLSWGIDPRVEADYRAHYGAIDPRRLLAAKLAAGDWLVCDRHFDRRAVARSEFFQDYLIPAGIRYLLGTRLTHHLGLDVYFGIHRAPGRPAFGDDEVDAMRRLTGHFQRATRLWLDTDALRQRVAIGQRALDSFESGVLATDAGGRVVYLNRYAEALLNGGPLRVRLGMLTASDQGDSRRVGNALQAAFATRQASSIRIGRGSEGGRGACSLTILPLPATRQFAGLLQAELLVLATPGRARRMLTTRQLMELFGLTPAEARLARALAGGETVDGYASSARLRATTVRTQLRSVFAKTGFSRQTDLVRQLVVVPVAR